ncbi:MAG: hypothetical protein JSW71_17880 [Gemmatimonadota bacterium]|nr:MAG: hypothetical protein JSW71_17880 [Gemmatimonadota bacterium]
MFQPEYYRYPGESRADRGPWQPLDPTILRNLLLANPVEVSTTRGALVGFLAAFTISVGRLEETMPFGRKFWAGIPIVLVVGAIIAVTYGKKNKERVVRIIEAPRVVVTPNRIKVDRPPPPPLNGSFVSLVGIGDDEMVSEGFKLSRPYDVRILALGEGISGEMYDYGWIINMGSHETVWRMGYHDTEHAGGAQKNRMVDEVVTLGPGNYMVYYVSDGSHSWDGWNASAPIKQEAWGISLLGADGTVDQTAVGAYEVSSDPAIVAQLIGIGDGERHSYRFSLDEETKVRVYALGEGDRSEMYDFAWIENAETGRAVWEMTFRTSQHAGGATKNRLFNDMIVLPAGQYILRYQSDGSHSADDWNSTPPNDPANYGVTLTKVKG